MKFGMCKGSHMNARIIYDLKVVHLFKFIFSLGLRAVYMLRDPHHLSPVLAQVVKFLKP